MAVSLYISLSYISFQQNPGYHGRMETASILICQTMITWLAWLHFTLDGSGLQRSDTRITLYYSIVRKTQRILDAFEPWFLVLKAVLGRQNSIKPLLSSSTNFLPPLLNFLGTKKHEVSLMVFSSKIKQSHFFFTLKMMTFTMVCITSKCCYRSKATLETSFVYLLYVSFWHFC